MTPMSLVYAAAMAGYVALAVVVLYGNRKSPLSWTTALLLVSLAVWSFEDVAHGNPAVPPGAFGNIGAVGWLTFPSLFVLFALVFTRRKRVLWSWPVYPVLFGIPAFFIYLQWTGRLMSLYQRHAFGWTTVWRGTVWPILYFVYYFVSVLFAISLILRFRNRTVRPAERRQAGLIALTATVALVLGTSSDVLFPNFVSFPIPELAGIFNLIWAAGLFVSVTRYGLLSVTPAAAAGDILAAMSDALLLLSFEGRIVTINQGAVELFGYTQADLAGRSADALFAQRVEFRRALEQAITEGALHLSEITCITRDGRNVPASASARVMRERSGIVTGVVWVLRDITERKQAE